MSLPLRRRRAIVMGMFLWWPLVLAAATTFAIINLCRPEKGTSGTYLVGLKKHADGTYVDHLAGGVQSVVDVDVVIRLDATHSPWVPWLSDGTPSWTAIDWSISIEPTSPAPSLTLSERRQIAATAFKYTMHPAPAGAAAAPPAGKTVVSGREVNVHYGRAALWLLMSLPGFLLMVWLVTGLALWLTRKDGRDATLCAHCGYSRTGIANGAACPECGKLPCVLRQQ